MNRDVLEVFLSLCWWVEGSVYLKICFSNKFIWFLNINYLIILYNISLYYIILYLLNLKSYYNYNFLHTWHVLNIHEYFYHSSLIIYHRKKRSYMDWFIFTLLIIIRTILEFYCGTLYTCHHAGFDLSFALLFVLFLLFLQYL